MPIHLKEDLIVELALMHKYGIITVLPFSKYASPIFAQRKPNGKLRLLVDLKKIKTLIADDFINNNHPVSTLSDAAQHLQGSLYFASLTAPKLVTACRWRTNNRWRLAQGLVSADLFLFSQAPSASTWTQLLMLTNVLNRWMIMELQPITLGISSGTLGQSSIAFARQDWN